MTKTTYSLYFFVLLLLALVSGIFTFYSEGLLFWGNLFICPISLFLAIVFGYNWELWAEKEDNKELIERYNNPELKKTIEKLAEKIFNQ